MPSFNVAADYELSDFYLNLLWSIHFISRLPDVAKVRDIIFYRQGGGGVLQVNLGRSHFFAAMRGEGITFPPFTFTKKKYQNLFPLSQVGNSDTLSFLEYFTLYSY